jgi:hypothetical protein
MRSQLVARRIFLAPALALTLAAAVAACSSSGSSSSSSTGAASAPASSSLSATPVPSSGSSTVAQITANWEKFFDSNTPVGQKVALLQNGTTFAPVISDLVNLPLASGLGAKVTNVAQKSATTATVTYNLTAAGTPLTTTPFTGTAVLQGGAWKVGDASLCGLFRLIPGGTVPAACNSVS